MRGKWLIGSVLPMLVMACGGDDGSTPTPTPTPTATTPTPTPTPAPTPTPTPTEPSPTATATPVVGVNDGFVAGPAIASLDTSLYEKRSYQAMPSIARIGARLWTVWLGSTKAGANEAAGDFLVMSYSDDEGANWSREYYLVPQNPLTDRTCDPRLWAAPDNTLWVMYCQSGNGVSHDGQSGVWVNIMKDPLSASPDFGTGFRVTDGVPMRPFQARGKWYWPIDYPFVAVRFPKRAGKNLFEFDWAKPTVRYVTSVPRSTNVDFTETTYVELKDGTILNQSRSLDGILESQAAPGQLGFTAPYRWTAYSSTASRHSLGRSPSGRLFMVFNKTQGPPGTDRTDLSVAFSEDEGKTWPYLYTFETRAQVSYPDIAFAQNGDILAVYDRQRTNAREILMARINEASIIAGTPRVTTTLVNKAKR